ncbi:MAG TPA: hypothetical protein PKY81_02385 [bacterium]|nr:hypothetical protein [bacterium]
MRETDIFKEFQKQSFLEILKRWNLLVFILLFVFSNCSDSAKKQESDKKAVNTEPTKAVSNFLNSYINYYNSKNIEGITGLYSIQSANTLEKKEVLTELFNSVDSIKVSYKDFNLIEETSQRIAFTVCLVKELKLGTKTINDERIVEYTLTNENNRFLLSNMKTLSIIK